MAKQKQRQQQRLTAEQQAVRLGARVGRRQGWDVFSRPDHNGRMQVQRLDEAGILDGDVAAVRLARAAGVRCDDDGWVPSDCAD